MILTKKQLEELEALAQPIVTWLTKNADPYIAVQIDQGSLKVTESIAQSIVGDRPATSRD